MRRDITENFIVQIRKFGEDSIRANIILKGENIMNNINVINNAGNNVNVTINEKDNGIQILIDTVHNNKKEQ